ncbi:hypothetical protein BU25DRAFT_455543 [Macroventuria anomochaeta]|uniref:Uncharacterized protein n=1 Tax=Macroventuria anomochaeta TaxID=301207 RepID=A0ACB6SD96_9PLEO|nr:uncharacterized protein BU25DRAFT_455543 [Macroventuria anomochaeta]KAF2631224.1 hypothetical protein BU25DRAFT_455543 [Macroventuria anomochaeta]
MLYSSRLVFGTEQEAVRLFANSSDTSKGGLTIQVGRSIDAQTVHVPQSVLDSCSILGGLLLPGCRIVNADPIVFAIIIEYLHMSSIMDLITFSTPGHLQELTINENPLLSLAKAWHVGDMLRMPDLQNRLFKVYRAYYMQCLEDRLRPPLDPEPLDSKPLDPEPFVYLRDNIGNHTKAEKFIVDFHAGLMQNQAVLKRNDFKLLPNDIAVKIRYRWFELSGRVRKDSLHPELSNDRIAAKDSCYRVTKDDAIVQSDLQIQYLSLWSHETGNSEATDDVSVYDLFAPNLQWNELPPEHSTQAGIFGLLDFAA